MPSAALRGRTLSAAAARRHSMRSLTAQPRKFMAAKQHFATAWRRTNVMIALPLRSARSADSAGSKRSGFAPGSSSVRHGVWTPRAAGNLLHAKVATFAEAWEIRQQLLWLNLRRVLPRCIASHGVTRIPLSGLENATSFAAATAASHVAVVQEASSPYRGQGCRDIRWTSSHSLPSWESIRYLCSMSHIITLRELFQSLAR